MVTLNRIYTRTGDAGTTRLASGAPASKSDLRVEAYGAVDETNACIGLARTHTAGDDAFDALLARLQNELFDLGADLATPAAEDEAPGARLRIAGAMTGSDQSFVKSLRRKLGDRAEFLPNLDRAAKQEFLRSLRVFSVPAPGEAFGMYVLEALASGVPVVQPRAGAFTELIAATGGGILCEPGNPAALAAGLEELLRDPVRARRLGSAGRQVVAEKFSVDAMSRTVEEILEKVIHAR